MEIETKEETHKSEKVTKKDKNEFTIRQTNMLAALKKELGNVTAASAKIGMSPRNHYKWLKSSEAYLEAFEHVQDSVLDMAESSLHKQIQARNTQATIFFLRTKGKKRGYIERQEVALSGGVAEFVQSFNETYEKSVSKE